MLRTASVPSAKSLNSDIEFTTVYSFFSNFCVATSLSLSLRIAIAFIVDVCVSSIGAVYSVLLACCLTSLSIA